MSKSKGRQAFSKRLRSQMAAVSKAVAKHEAMLKNTVESKQIYVENSSAIPTGNSFTHIQLLDGLAQGVADTGSGGTVQTGARIGNSINCKSLSLRFILDGFRIGANPANPAVKTAGLHRVIIYDSPCGEDLLAADLLREATTEIAAMRSHYNVAIQQGKMYNIWYDRTFVLSDAKPAAVVNFRKKWKKGKKVLYDDTATAPSNFRPKMLVISTDVAPGGNNTVSFSSKLRFDDL